MQLLLLLPFPSSGAVEATMKMKTSRNVRRQEKNSLTQSHENAGFYRGSLDIKEDGETTTGQGYAILTPSGKMAVLAINGTLSGYFSDGLEMSGNVDLWAIETASTAYPLNGSIIAGESISGTSGIGFLASPDGFDFQAQYQYLPRKH